VVFIDVAGEIVKRGKGESGGFGKDLERSRLGFSERFENAEHDGLNVLNLSEIISG